MITICNSILTPGLLKPETYNPLKSCGLELGKLAKRISDINNIIQVHTPWTPSQETLDQAHHNKSTRLKKGIHYGCYYPYRNHSIKLLRISSGFYNAILQKCYEQLDAMMSHHSKVLVIRYDFHLHDHTDCNKIMSTFIRKLRKRLKPHYKFKRMGYIWVREWNKEKGLATAQHYHCAIMLNGNQVLHPEKINGIVIDIWDRLGQAHVYLPKHQYYLIKHGDTEKLASARERLSYLAKVYTKGNKERYTNNYSTSRIPLNTNLIAERQSIGTTLTTQRVVH